MFSKISSWESMPILWNEPKISTMNVQYIILGVILVLAVAYAAWRIYHVFHHADDPCCCCEGCSMKEMKRQGKTKKCPKNLQDTNK